MQGAAASKVGAGEPRGAKDVVEFVARLVCTAWTDASAVVTTVEEAFGGEWAEGADGVFEEAAAATGACGRGLRGQQEKGEE